MYASQLQDHESRVYSCIATVLVQLQLSSARFTHIKALLFKQDIKAILLPANSTTKVWLQHAALCAHAIALYPSYVYNACMRLQNEVFDHLFFIITPRSVGVSILEQPVNCMFSGRLLSTTTKKSAWIHETIKTTIYNLFIRQCVLRFTSSMTQIYKYLCSYCRYQCQNKKRL